MRVVAILKKQLNVSWQHRLSTEVASTLPEDNVDKKMLQRGHAHSCGI